MCCYFKSCCGISTYASSIAVAIFQLSWLVPALALLIMFEVEISQPNSSFLTTPEYLPLLKPWETQMKPYVAALIGVVGAYTIIIILMLIGVIKNMELIIIPYLIATPIKIFLSLMIGIAMPVVYFAHREDYSFMTANISRVKDIVTVFCLLATILGILTAILECIFFVVVLSEFRTISRQRHERKTVKEGGGSQAENHIIPRVNVVHTRSPAENSTVSHERGFINPSYQKEEGPGVNRSNSRLQTFQGSNYGREQSSQQGRGPVQQPFRNSNYGREPMQQPSRNSNYGREPMQQPSRNSNYGREPMQQPSRNSNYGREPMQQPFRNSNYGREPMQQSFKGPNYGREAPQEGFSKTRMEDQFSGQSIDQRRGYEANFGMNYGMKGVRGAGNKSDMMY
ncbi:unnamed protein product [Darwinula stevensoni]|uniref:Uncharacterized protein n=1 Tax=Darwinula stevensoni TaxID=69355 RepID=A0A7R8X3M0_9CRUS|nr:unnamed protein product [Darwinula stevensoni]CAG0878703.1 unnamed protein product [Darwinula stevensoni]